MNNLNTNADEVSQFTKKGIIEYFNRVEYAQKKKKEIEKLQNKEYGQTWQNKVTIPQEFNFMRNKNNYSRRDYSPNITCRK